MSSVLRGVYVVSKRVWRARRVRRLLGLMFCAPFGVGESSSRGFPLSGGLFWAKCYGIVLFEGLVILGESFEFL